MKNFLFILSILFLASCTEGPLQFDSREIIDGKVSEVQHGYHGGEYAPDIQPAIWVQTSTSTNKVELPFEYDYRWQVGDSCLLIIEKYRIIEEK
jgi:hypothetical protein